jgi:hypothetical protein
MRSARLGDELEVVNWSDKAHLVADDFYNGRTVEELAVKGGEIGRALQDMVQKLQPEAAYFGAGDGERTAFIGCWDDMRREAG